MTHKAIIVDDEQHCSDALGIKLKEHCKDIVVSTVCTNVSEAIEAIHYHRPDLVFLDINMPQEDGFSLLERLPQIDFEIIFTTAYDKYAVKAFEFSAVHFLLKPIQTDQLVRAVDRFRERKYDTSLKQVTTMMDRIRQRDTRDRIALPTATGYRFVELKEVVRLQGESNYSHFYLSDGTGEIVPKTLKEYEDLLAEDAFVRIHKSHLINMNHVKAYRKTDGVVTMSDGTTIEVSSRRKGDFLQELSRFIKV